MTPGKRALDLVLAVLLGAILLPVMAAVALAIRLIDGAPVLHWSERMRAPGVAFWLVKFRTMTPSATDAGVTGGDKADRITRTGRFLRASRLDELPQLWNILRGDMSFVGPRPPLRAYVERFPGLYARVLRSRPGVTGLATLVYHRHEERLLARCRTPQETDRTYATNCVPRKARLDLIYQANRGAGLDLMLMIRTILRRIPLHRRNRRRPRESAR
jgi:lipopolysaccharide/colanic/teichoic acid biosynthesis glycosyltransferase